jgi:hypothetical protein
MAMKKRLSNEEIYEIAADHGRKKVLKDCKEVKLTPRRVLRRLAEGLDAIENKIFYDKDRGRCIVGPDQINWSARQKAVDQAISILGLKPPEKKEINGELKLNHELTPEVQDLFNRIYAR